MRNEIHTSAKPGEATAFLHRSAIFRASEMLEWVRPAFAGQPGPVPLFVFVQRNMGVGSLAWVNVFNVTMALINKKEGNEMLTMTLPGCKLVGVVDEPREFTDRESVKVEKYQKRTVRVLVGTEFVVLSALESVKLPEPSDAGKSCTVVLSSFNNEKDVVRGTLAGPIEFTK